MGNIPLPVPAALGGSGVTGSTGSGSVVLSTSPTLVTPALGTPSALVLTNATGTPSSIGLANGTGLPLATGISGFGTGIATALAINTGSAGAPVLFNGAGGTPSSLTLTNATGLPIAGLTASTVTAIGVGSIELGHATDTTITRTGAGAIAVEGVAVLLSGGALGTPSSGTLTNATGLPIAGLTASTVTAIGVGSIELGHATDTTIARSGAGDITIEGNAVYRAGGTDVPVADGGTGSSTAGGAATNLGLGTGSDVTHKTLVLTGTSGSLNFTAATDGADYNIFSSNGAQTLALYGSAGNTLSLNLLDGNLTVGGSTVTLGEGTNMVLGTTTGTKIGTATNQKLGFFNSTPIVKGTAFTQTYSTASHTHANITASNPPAGGTGTTAGAYDTAANRNAMITSLTNNIADVANVKQVLNALIDDLQALGLIA